MRRGLLAVGLTALLLGLLVALAPIFPVPSGARSVGGDTIAFFQVHSLVFPQYLQVPWTAPASTTVFAVNCGGTEPVSSAFGPCPTNRTVAKGTGTSGTLSFSASDGDWIYIGTSGPGANITLRTTNGEVGFVVTVLGGIVAVASLLPTRDERPSRAVSPRPSRPSTDEPPQEEGPEATERETGSDAATGSPSPAEAQEASGAEEKAEGTS